MQITSETIIAVLEMLKAECVQHTYCYKCKFHTGVSCTLGECPNDFDIDRLKEILGSENEL